MLALIGGGYARTPPPATGDSQRCDEPTGDAWLFKAKEVRDLEGVMDELGRMESALSSSQRLLEGQVQTIASSCERVTVIAASDCSTIRRETPWRFADIERLRAELAELRKEIPPARAEWGKPFWPRFDRLQGDVENLTRNVVVLFSIQQRYVSD